MKSFEKEMRLLETINLNYHFKIYEEIVNYYYKIKDLQKNCNECEEGIPKFQKIIDKLERQILKNETELSIVYKLADKMSKEIFKTKYPNKTLIESAMKYDSWVHGGDTINED